MRDVGDAGFRGLVGSLVGCGSVGGARYDLAVKVDAVGGATLVDEVREGLDFGELVVALDGVVRDWGDRSDVYWRVSFGPRVVLVGRA